VVPGALQPFGNWKTDLDTQTYQISKVESWLGKVK